MNIKFEWTRFIKSCLYFASKNRRPVLTGITLAETLANTLVSARSGWRVHDIYNRMLVDLSYCNPYDTLSRKNVIFNAFTQALPDLASSVIMTGVTSGTILYNHKVNSAQIATLGAAYSATRAALEATDTKVQELFGDKKYREVRQSLAQDRTNEVGVVNNPNTVILTSKGSYIAVDSDTGRVFRTCGESLNEAVQAISDRINDYHFASLNDLYIELGLETVPRGNEFGFPESECFKTSSGKCKAPIDIMTTNYKGEPAFYIDYPVYVRPDYL